MKDLIEKIMAIDMGKIPDASPEDLSEVYDLIKQVEGVLAVTKKEIGINLLTRFEGSGTIYGKYGVSRVITPNYSKVSMEIAEQFGAVKQSIDGSVLGKLLKKGQAIEGVTYTESVRVNSLDKSEEESEIQ